MTLERRFLTVSPLQKQYPLQKVFHFNFIRSARYAPDERHFFNSQSRRRSLTAKAGQP
jgi:hypothetical protein